MRFVLDKKVSKVGFGVRYCVKGVCRNHSGVDYEAYYVPVYAPIDGRITALPFGREGGKWLFFVDKNGFGLQFAHLDRYLKKVGSVKEGEKMAISGNTGYLTSGPHLHLEVRSPKGVIMNPEDYFRGIMPAPDYLKRSRFFRVRGKPKVFAITHIPDPRAFEQDYGGDWNQIINRESRFYRRPGRPEVFDIYHVPDPDWFERICDAEWGWIEEKTIIDISGF